MSKQVDFFFWFVYLGALFFNFPGKLFYGLREFRSFLVSYVQACQLPREINVIVVLVKKYKKNTIQNSKRSLIFDFTLNVVFLLLNFIFNPTYIWILVPSLVVLI